MSEESLPAKPEEIIVPKPPQQPDGTRRIQAISHAEAFSGPLPPPELLGKYETLCPGSAERIIAMAERESEHRRSIEQALVRSESDQDVRDSHEARRGQICALIITLAGIGAGAYTALQGHEIAGSILGVGGITSIVSSFLAGKAKQEKEPATEGSSPRPNASKSAKKARKK